MNFQLAGYTTRMETLFKIFAGFWLIWIIWYLTGGPLRDDTTKPFVELNQAGQIENTGKPVQ